MEPEQRSLETLQDIRRMMERSSRFISLSGLSGISAGACALVGAWLAAPYISGEREHIINEDVAILQAMAHDYSIILNSRLFWIAVGTFVAALCSAFFFTWLKSRNDGIPVWGSVARRLMINVSIPLIVGGVFLFRLAQSGAFGLVAPGCLIFYGLALVNASKYTLPEIRYLGFAQILLGLVNLWFTGFGLQFWAAGFGLLHIIYGSYMWFRYERVKD